MLKTLPCFGHSFLLVNCCLFLSVTTTVAQIPPPPPAEGEGDVYQFQAPNTSPTNPVPRNNSTSSNPLFRVQVYGSSEQLLSLVRRIEPDAFVRDGKNVIQAGLFSDAVNAIQLVQSLSEQGIEADIIKIPRSQSRSSSSSEREMISLSSVPETQTPPEANANEMIPLAIEPPTPTADASQTLISERPNNQKGNRGYYVVIPSNESRLSQISEQVEEAGVRPSLIQQRNAPRGNHLAVGPFIHRTEANRWSSELQTQGLDARVYFGR